jgi:hypothetical protein
MADLLTLDVEATFVSFLLSRTALTALVSTRIGTRKDSTDACITVRRVAGGLTFTDGPEDNPTLQVDCWANGDDEDGASLIARTLVSVLPEMRAYNVHLGPHFVSLILPSSDPDTGRARVQVDVDLLSYPGSS